MAGGAVRTRLKLCIGSIFCCRSDQAAQTFLGQTLKKGAVPAPLPPTPPSFHQQGEREVTDGDEVRIKDAH